MKRKNELTFLAIFILVVGTSIVYLFQTSYAKYRRTANTELNATIARWALKVNNQDINHETTLTNTITPTLEVSEYVKEGTIAPGSTGYFDIIIDASDVDVDFTFTVDGNYDETTPLSDLIFDKYKINDEAEITYSETTGITGTITKNTAETNVRVYFKWNDDITNNMSNEDDTVYSQNEDFRTTKINVAIHFQQKNS